MRRSDRDRAAGGTSAVVRQTILLTGALSVLPLLPYPNTLGLGLFPVRPLLGLLEAVLYVGAFSLLASRLTVPQRVAGAALTLVFRYTLGATCGTVLAISNNLSWGQSVALAIWSYPPALLLHLLTAPLVMHALLKELWGREVRRNPRAAFSPVQGGIQRKVENSRRPDSRHHLTQGTMTPRTGSPRLPSLDDAVAYVGEYAGVRMCWMVDQEGLPLAVWQRQEYTGSADFWAPISLEIVEFDRRILSVAGEVRPQRVEVRTDAGRIILETVGEFWLGVLTDRDTDELIGLRLSQSRDMILKHLHERRAQYVGLQEARYV